MKNNILDHGYIRLVDSMGSDLSIVRSARVSYNADWRAGKDTGSDEKLIRYLMENGHNTPFESVVATFEVKAPIFVVRQWHRHRTQSYNEVSARYTELPEEFYIPKDKVVGLQSKHNKQCRDLEENQNASEIIQMITEQNKLAFEKYHKLLELGCPREIARTILPLGTYTKMFATANLHNWFNFLRERLHPHAQYEIREYAKIILQELETIAPVACGAFKAIFKQD